jgi:NhaA family Na+:H+ antiporter
LVALAIIDDLGAIVTIAFFYSQQIAWLFLLAACLIFALLLLLNKLNRSEAWLYVLGGIILWYCLLQSGVHPTIGGVLLAFAIPFKTIKNSSLAENFYHQLSKPVAFVIVPLFALANTAIFIPDGVAQQLFSSNSLGIFLGLVIGKPLGITLFTLLAITIGIGKLPFDIKMKHIFGAGLLGGIGFTMSMFISMLAFDTTEIQEISKLTIIVSSAVAAALGWLWLKLIKN